MALEDVLIKVKDAASELWGRVQETPVYNNIREKYETLTPTTQRGVMIGAIALGVILLLMWPYTYLADSASLNDNYVSNRDLIRKLLRASRLAADAVNLPRTVDVSSLKSQLQDTLGQFSLLPEQNAGVIDIESKTLGSSMSAGNLKLSALGVSLKKLNLEQMIDIGDALQGKNPNVKLSGIEITASQPDNHYYDVLYKLAIYNMPIINSDTGDAGGVGGPNAGGGGNGKGKRGGGSFKPKATPDAAPVDKGGGDSGTPPAAGSGADDGQ